MFERNFCSGKGSQPIGRFPNPPLLFCIVHTILMLVSARLQIVFIDEIDALAPSRGSPGGGQASNSPVSARLVTTLLTELDSIRGACTVNVLVTWVYV